MTAIYLDLDGVLADFELGVTQTTGLVPDPSKRGELNRSGTEDPFKRQMYDAVRGTDFYARLPIMPGAVELYLTTAPYAPVFLTASPKFGASEDDHHVNPHWLGAAYHKRRWIERVFLPKVHGVDHEVAIADERFICTTSAKKHRFMHRVNHKNQLLIDDRRDNCVAWQRAGGDAILHVEVDRTLEALIDYLVTDGNSRYFYRGRDGRGSLSGLEPHDMLLWSEKRR